MSRQSTSSWCLLKASYAFDFLDGDISHEVDSIILRQTVNRYLSHLRSKNNVLCPPFVPSCFAYCGEGGGVDLQVTSPSTTRSRTNWVISYFVLFYVLQDEFCLKRFCVQYRSSWTKISKMSWTSWRTKETENIIQRWKNKSAGGVGLLTFRLNGRTTNHLKPLSRQTWILLWILNQKYQYFTHFWHHNVTL